MRELTNYSKAILGAAVVLLAGCASTPERAVLQPIGPAPGASVSANHKGFLQIYSARARAVTDLNAEEFFWNNDFGRNEFLYGHGRTGYAIYADSQLVQHVRNAEPGRQSNPALVALPPGTYEVHAQAEDADALTFTAVVPVVIRPGEVTVAYLSQDREPHGADKGSDLVWLPNGRVAGWRARTTASVASQGRAD